MDPLSGATAFATIVSLVGQYRAERERGNHADPHDFLAWLMESKHDEIRQALESNDRAMMGVTALLSFDPENARERHQEYHPDAVDLTAAFSDGGASQGVAADERTDDGAAVEYDPDQERAPWL